MESLSNKQRGVRINVVGRISLLPDDLKALVTCAMLTTRKNNKLLLNIAYANTGRDEISRAASHIVVGVKSNEITINDIDVDLVSQALDLGEAELLIRTSGEVRLSDFMLWQVSNAVLYFTEILWPEFTIWNFLAAITYFQRNTSVYKAAKVQEQQIPSMAKQQFLDKLNHRNCQKLENIVSFF